MGLLTDLLGGAAIATHGVLQRENKAEEELAKQKSLADYQADIATKKQMLLEELAAEREQRKQKDFANAADKAETRSTEIGTDRRFQKFMEDGKQAGYFEGMSPEEIKGVFEQTYDDKRVSAETGGDRYQDKTLAVKADDFVKASRETGNSGLLTQALNDRKTAIGQDNTRATEAFKEREAKRKEEADRVREEQRDKQLDIQNRSVTAAIARSGSSGKSDGPDPIKERTAIVAELRQLEATKPKKPDMPTKASQKQYETELEAWKKTPEGEAAEALRARQVELLSPKPSTSKPAGGQSDRLSQFKVIR